MGNIVHSKDIAESIRQITASLNTDKVFIICDANVKSIYWEILGDYSSIFTLPPGETSKSLEQASRIWEWLAETGATRRSVVVTIGGGVTSDLGGFCASTFMRGIRFVNVPTTLLAMADAAIGGKTGIDFKGMKNEVGTFAMPEYVIVWPGFLDSLPERELKSGFAEVVKTAMLTDTTLYHRLIEGEALSDPALLGEAAWHAAEAKQRIVEEDPKEKGLRRILNFGHTFGHAYEETALDAGIPLTHGEAVAHGILRALEVSVRHAGLPANIPGDYRRLILERYYPPLPLSEEQLKHIPPLILRDKKSLGNGMVDFVMLEDIGSPIVKPWAP